MRELQREIEWEREWLEKRRAAGRPKKRGGRDGATCVTGVESNQSETDVKNMMRPLVARANPTLRDEALVRLPARVTDIERSARSRNLPPPPRQLLFRLARTGCFRGTPEDSTDMRSSRRGCCAAGPIEFRGAQEQQQTSCWLFVFFFFFFFGSLCIRRTAPYV